MRKKDTVAKYLNDFLAGRSEQYKATFLAKDIEHQYLSIYSWLRRRSEKSRRPALPGIADQILAAARRIAKVAYLEDNEESDIRAAVAAVEKELDNARERRRQNEIEKLEKEHEMIAERLRLLREQ